MGHDSGINFSYFGKESNRCFFQIVGLFLYASCDKSDSSFKSVRGREPQVGNHSRFNEAEATVFGIN